MDPKSSTSISDFTIHGKLGEGAFSSVYKVTRKSDRLIYAMKQVKMNKLTDKEKINAVNEVRILASVQDPNVIGYKEAFYDDYSQCLCIIQEFAPGGDLMSIISENIKKKHLMNEEVIWTWFIQMISGLKKLHSMNIMHRDIKSANIFLMKDLVQAKLGDLNVSKVTKRNQMAVTQTGTPYYASPEIWKDCQYGHKCDIWSLGCVIYEMAALKPPFRAMNMEGLYRKISRGTFERIPQKFSSELHHVISQCLQVNPQNRPDCDQLLKLPAISKRFTSVMDSIKTQSSINSPNSHLINTIKVPRNLKLLKERLPKAAYQSQIDVINNSVQNPNQKISPNRSQSIENESSYRGSRQGIRKNRPLQPIDPNQIANMNNNNNSNKMYYNNRNRAGSLHTHNKAGQIRQISPRRLVQCPSSNNNNKENLLPNIPKKQSKPIIQTPQINSQNVKIIQYQRERSAIRLRSSDKLSRQQNSQKSPSIFQAEAKNIRHYFR